MDSKLSIAGTHGGLAVRRVPLSSIKPDPANARAHGERNLASIVASLERFGQAEPLVVNGRTGRLVAGHGRLLAMRQLGWAEADVVEVDLAEIDATALGIALNRTGELAEWDDAALGAILQVLQAEDALAGVGFDEAEIDEVIARLSPIASSCYTRAPVDGATSESTPPGATSPASPLPLRWLGSRPISARARRRSAASP